MRQRSTLRESLAMGGWQQKKNERRVAFSPCTPPFTPPTPCHNPCLPPIALRDAPPSGSASRPVVRYLGLREACSEPWTGVFTSTARMPHASRTCCTKYFQPVSSHTPFPNSATTSPPPPPDITHHPRLHRECCRPRPPARARPLPCNTILSCAKRVMGDEWLAHSLQHTSDRGHHPDRVLHTACSPAGGHEKTFLILVSF